MYGSSGWYMLIYEVWVGTMMHALWHAFNNVYGNTRLHITYGRWDTCAVTNIHKPEACIMVYNDTCLHMEGDSDNDACVMALYDGICNIIISLFCAFHNGT